MTDELKEYLNQWIDIKYRERRLYLRDKHCNKIVKPIKKEDDLVFSSSFTYDGDSYNANNGKRANEQDNVTNIYVTLLMDFNKMINQLKIGFEDTARRRHVFTFHSMRRWVKSVISAIVSSDFSEWAIGHSGSVYYTKSEKEKYALFKRCEPYLTYLDQSGLEQKQTDMQSRLETMEQEYKNLQDNMNRVMEMIQENPKLARVKPEVLAKKR